MGMRTGEMPSAGNCRQCGAAIVWKTTNGKRVPVNALPIPVAMLLERDSDEVVIRPAFAVHESPCKRHRASHRTGR